MVLVDDLDAPVLSPDDRHHLERVLRLRPGDPLTLADGAGRWRTGVLAPDFAPDVAPDVAPDIATTPIVTEPFAGPELAIGFALVKGDKPELIVQKLTELGVDRIIPFAAARSVVRWDAVKAAKAVSRLRSVARAAAMQSHRPRLPIVEDLAALEDLAARPGVVRAERGGHAPARGHHLVLVGPEGGWAAEEEALEIPTVAFAQNVLRAETAAITAGAVITALRSGIIEPRGTCAT